MRRLLTSLACMALAFACVLSCGAQALAAPADGDPASIGSLSSRYSMLDELANSRTPDENVVVETRIGVLTGANQALDGSAVRFAGEVVGEPVNAESGLKWVSVNDSSGQSIAVLLTQDQLAGIDAFGDYQHTGTQVEVTGVYHVACGEHQGELDVHVAQIEITSPGSAREHAVDRDTLVMALALTVIGLLLVVTYAVLSRRAGKKEDA